MLHNSKIKKVLLLGSGALQIGQAGEFDYSGSQAIKALKEEGIEVILINPNIATIQTSQGFANQVYFLPIEPHFVEEVIKLEKPQGILLSFGGQTALNCGLELERKKILQKNNVKVLGTPTSAIKKTEDRHLFVKTLNEINLLTPKSQAAKEIKNAQQIAKEIGYPVMVRAGFSLGGQDSGVAQNEKQLTEIVQRALSKSPQVLIEEYLSGWKEIEYEVVRDRLNNCITVCNMENIDPMGIHTGESIVVAPTQTLNNFEYHTLREIAIKVIRHLGIVGECNIQFALNPNPKSEIRNPKQYQNSNDKNSKRFENLNLENPLLRSKIRDSEHLFRASNFDIRDLLNYRIIEVNARLSRSSALASKATGYPLAYVAAKLGLGYSLVDIKNAVTKKTIAAFEPALDYLVIKIPRWDLGKFQRSENQIGSSMQSVGEIMAIGRKFEEAIQKAARMLDIGLDGILDENAPQTNFAKPTPWRIFAIAQALKKNVPVNKIYKATGIDPFFLHKIKNIVEFEKEIESRSMNHESRNRNHNSEFEIHNSNLLLTAKQLGFSDKRIANLLGSTEDKIRNLRTKLGIHPAVKQIDTLAAEYPTETNYLYLTYNGDKDDISEPDQKPQSNDLRFKNKDLRNHKSKIINHKSVIVLGSGPYRIGSSVEFDWCSVTCAQTVTKYQLSPIIINCNPETVSTDFDMAEKLYFEELTTETILEIYKKENPLGIIVSMGGQTPSNLVMDLAKNKLNILGTKPKSIDQAEDRNKFSSLCDHLQINQPAWSKLINAADALNFAAKIGYPVLVRPSYVLSGAAMNVAFDIKDLKNYLKLAAHVSQKYPVVISKFIEKAKELEIDAVAKNGRILTFAISEHVENAGVHSGDSTLVLPPQKIYLATEKEIEGIAQKLAHALAITGPFNIQFVAKDNKVMVIECNLRASRSLPFVSKVIGINFVKLATEAILQKTSKFEIRNSKFNNYVGVKAPQFSFSRIRGADPILRVEMTSTGEVACFGRDVYEAFLKSLIATGIKLPKRSVFVSVGGDESKAKFLESAGILSRMGLEIFATEGTSAFLTKNNIKSQCLHKIHENKKPNILDFLLTKKIDLVINIVDPNLKKEFDDEYLIRRASIDYGVPILTNLQTAQLFVHAIHEKKLSDLKVLPWSFYVKNPN